MAKYSFLAEVTFKDTTDRKLLGAFPYFPAFGLNTELYSVRMRENTDQKNFEYGHFLRSAISVKEVINTLQKVILRQKISSKIQKLFRIFACRD